MNEQEFVHRPVLLDECIDALAIRPDGIYLDGTLGRAGHSREIARRLTTGRLICVDRDQAALDAAADKLGEQMERVTLVHSNFDRLDEILDTLGIGGVNGMLFDLGVSSPQLDDPARGFSYMQDAPLDMRMDRTDTLTARTVVNEWPQEELRRILYQYGEERYAPAIAAAIVRARGQAPVETTLQLVEIIRSAMPAAALREKQPRKLLKGEISSPIDPKPGCRFASRCPYATELCRTQSPGLEEVLPGHYVSCHRVREINQL